MFIKEGSLCYNIIFEKSTMNDRHLCSAKLIIFLYPALPGVMLHQQNKKGLIHICISFVSLIQANGLFK